MTQLLQKIRKKRQPEGDSALRFTERDLDALRDLGDYRFLSTPQLAALHYGTERGAAERLRRLTDAGLALKVFMPVRPYDRRSQTIYALAARGAALVAAHRDGKRPRHLTERERRSGLFLDHTLRRNDLRVILELLSAKSGCPFLLVWRQLKEEVAASAEVLVGRFKRARVPIVPDGFFALSYQGGCTAYVVEIDMGTVRLERMALRYRAYWRWWKRGGHIGQYGKMPIRVLTLTTTERRLEALRSAARQAPENGSPGTNLFWFTRLEHLDLNAPEKLLDPIWTTAARTLGPPRALFEPQRL